MAHHVFRRCLLADVVPPAPPVMPAHEDRCALGSGFAFRADGVEFSTSVAGLDVLSGFRVVPIPPGVETGDSLDRVALASRFYRPAISFPGLDLWGIVNQGGVP